MLQSAGKHFTKDHCIKWRLFVVTNEVRRQYHQLRLGIEPSRANVDAALHWLENPEAVCPAEPEEQCNPYVELRALAHELALFYCLDGQLELACNCLDKATSIPRGAEPQPLSVRPLLNRRCVFHRHAEGSGSRLSPHSG